MSSGNVSVHRNLCHDFYVGTAPYTLLNTPRLRIDIIEVVNFVPTALFLLWLLVTLPWSVRRFWRGRKGQTGLVAYFGLIWATALFRGLRFVLLWAAMGGDAPAHITKVELILYALYLTSVDTVEISFILLFANGIFGNPKWLDRRVIIQSVCVFVIVLTVQLLLTFVGHFSLLEDDNPRNAPFWFTYELAFTLLYLVVIFFKFLPCTRARFPPSLLVLTYLSLLMIMHGLTGIGQLLQWLGTRNSFCPLVVGNISYYYLASPLLYLTFLGTYLHPGCCKLLGTCPCWCCGKMRYTSLVGDDALYDYEPVDTLPTVKHWIPPSQLNISSPYYPRHTSKVANTSGYYSAPSWSEAEESSSDTSAPNTLTREEEYDYEEEEYHQGPSEETTPLSPGRRHNIN